MRRLMGIGYEIHHLRLLEGWNVMFIRNLTNRTPGIATITAVAAAAVVLAAGPASAASWVHDPGASCVPTSTPRDRTVSSREIQVRAGTCSGAQYGWGRVIGYQNGDYIRFEVDTNGDRIPDVHNTWLATNRNYTDAWPTSSSSQVAMRACLVSSLDGTCNSGNATNWW